MYQPGQQVVYGGHGVCSILELEDRMVDRKPIRYYVLQPLEQSATRYYVPTHNENALAKMRPLMDKEALLALLQSGQVKADCWIPDENRRKQYYRQLISSIDLEAVIRMIHCLRQQKATLLQAGKRFHMCDENFLQDAQKILSSELSVVLQVPRQELDGYLKELMGE